eukprot:COSAG05_NODE_15840_length_359_cov_4.173077_1_plen_57_part_01
MAISALLAALLLLLRPGGALHSLWTHPPRIRSPLILSPQTCEPSLAQSVNATGFVSV